MLILVVVFIFGLIVGSLLNVIVYRTEKNKSFVWGRSFCPKCKKQLQWYDNIPLLSFCLLGGRCRSCKKNISWQYPLVELAMGVLVAVAFWKLFGLNRFMVESPDDWLTLATAFLLVGCLIVVFVYDLKHFLILDKFVFFGLIVALVSVVITDIRANFWPDFFLPDSELPLISSRIIRSALGALLAGGFFFLLVFLSKEKWMGWGDVKFGAFMGLLLGFPQVISALFIAYFLGSLVGVALLLSGRKKMKSEIPFGPFLCIGTYVAFLYGNELVYLYLSILNL